MNELKLFPSTKSEALAYLYMEKQNITGITPEEFVKMYNDAYERINKELNSNPSKVKTF